MTDETCGHPTADDTPCQHPVTDDGDPDRCWIDAHNEADVEAGQPGRQFPDPEKLDLQRQEDIAQTVEQGKSISAAARMSGITPSTAIRWMQLGRDQEEGPYREFFERLTRALGFGQNKWEDLLLEAAKDDPSTIMAVLKTQFPNEWGDVDRGEQAGGVVVNLGEEEEYEVDADTLEVVGEAPES